MVRVLFILGFLLAQLIGVSQDLLYRDYPRNYVLASPWDRTGKPNMRLLKTQDIPDLSSIYIPLQIPNRADQSLLMYNGTTWTAFPRSYYSDYVLKTISGKLKWVPDTTGGAGLDSLEIEVVDHPQFPIEYLRYYYNTNPWDTVTTLIKPHGVVAGGYVNWIADTTFNVESCLYFLYGDMYVSPETEIKIRSGDPVDPRIDIIVVSDDSTVSVIQGVPSVDPVKPQFNPLTQLELTHIYVPAGAVNFDTLIYREIIYNENVEWVGSSSGVTVDFAYGTNPFTGTVCADVGTLSTGDEVIWTNSTSVLVSDFNILVFAIKLKAVATKNDNIVVQFYNGSTPASDAVKVNINKSLLTWQISSLELSSFNWSGIEYDKVVFRFDRPSGTYSGIYLDYVKVEVGVPQPYFDNSIILTGDISGSGITGIPIITTLDSVNANVGVFGGIDTTLQIEVDNKGRVLSVVEYPVTSGAIYKIELSSPQTIFDVGFTLTSNTVISYNGQELRDSQWTGVGTTTLTIYLDTKQNDFLLVKR